MNTIRDIQFEAFDDRFEVKFFFAFKKECIILAFVKGMPLDEAIALLLNFVIALVRMK